MSNRKLFALSKKLTKLPNIKLKNSRLGIKKRHALSKRRRRWNEKQSNRRDSRKRRNLLLSKRSQLSPLWLMAFLSRPFGLT